MTSEETTKTFFPTKQGEEGYTVDRLNVFFVIKKLIKYKWLTTCFTPLFLGTHHCLGHLSV